MLITDALHANALACAFFNRTFLTEPNKEVISLYKEQHLFDEWPFNLLPYVGRSELI